MIRFKLQTVLKLREQTEDVEKRKLGEFRTEEKQLQLQYDYILAEQQEVRKVIETRLKGVINPIEVQQMNHYLQDLKRQGCQLEKRIIEKQEQIVKQQKKLAEAMKDRKVLENLKQLKIEEFLQEEKQKEQLMTDELVSYKYSATERSDADGKY